MTVLEQHFDFDLKLDKIATQTKRDFSVAEVDWLLNEAQNVIIKRYYQGTNTTGTAFETTQKRIDDLSSLLIKYPIQPELIPTILDNNIYEINLSTLAYPYWIFASGQVKVLVNDCVKLADLKLISHDDFSDPLKDPFNKSDKSEILFNFGRASNISTNDFSRSSIYIYPDTMQIISVRLNYLKKPSRINYGGYAYIDGIVYPQQNCELPDLIHTELVDIAVQIAAGIIESPEYMQMKTQKVFSND
jgi:hypothetical protein